MAWLTQQPEKAQPTALKPPPSVPSACQPLSLQEELDKAIMQFDATVDVTELMGAEIYLYVNIAGQPITARVAPTSKSKVGDKIKVCFSLDKLHIFDKDTEEIIAN